MAEKSRMHLALDRFETALRGFEVAVSHAKDAGKRRHMLEDEKRLLLEDRSRLAEELDEVKARANRLEKANSQVSVRLGAAMDNIKTILGSA
jgi:hypothetical protein